MEKEKAKKPFYKKWWVWLIAVFIFGAAASGGEEESTTPKEDTKVAETSAKVNEKEENSQGDEKAKQEAEDKKKAEEEAAKKKAEEDAKKNTPEYKLNASLTKALGKESNRDGKKIAELAIDQEGNISYVIKGDENLTENLTITSMQMDIADTLEAVKKSKVDFKNVNVKATYSMVDQYGNSEEDEVINLNYSKATVDKINFKNFNTENIYLIADNGGFIHPAFQPKE